MPDGFLNLLKPPGMSSFLAVHLVRRLLPRGCKVGHMGTLDPAAAGVLPIGIGAATRLFDYVTEKKKLYRAELCIGAATDTQDATGQVVETLPPVSLDCIRGVLPRFIGKILQSPPLYSAIHIDGKRAYELAREGKAPQRLPEREIEVYDISFVGESGENRCLLDISCGKGTYIRTLLHDIAHAAGSAGHMSLLIRLASGVFSIEDAVTPEELRQASQQGVLPLLPLDAPILHLPRLDLPASALSSVRNGNPIRGNFGFAPDQPVRIYANGRFAGIAKHRENEMRFSAMLLKD